MADIVLYDRTGSAVTYSGVDTITTDTPTDGETATFTYGKVVQGTEIDLALADGDQTVSVPAGSLLREATIKKPETLTPEHIKKGVDVAGVIGTFAGDEMEKTVDLNMANGDQIVDADPDTVMTRVTVKKPETLVPENIVEGVDIGGVLGTQKDNSVGLIEGTVEDIANANITSISPYAFYMKSALKTASFANCKTIGNYAFAFCSSLQTVEIPECEVFSGAAQFSNCVKLTKVSFPKCTSIGITAFYGCSNLSEAIFPECSIIGQSAFANCSKLANIDFGKCIEIGSYAFSYCKSLVSISAENCETIQHLAFAYATSLTSVYFPNLKRLVSNAFQGCTKLSKLQSSVYYVSDMAVSASGTFSNVSCILKEGTRLLANYLFLGKSRMSGVSGTSNLEIIGDYAFSGAYYANFPDGFPSAKWIGNGAFYACSSLTTVSIPLCEHVGANAFGGCSRLSEFYAPNLESIQYQLFLSKSYLSSAKIDKAKYIGLSAFANCYSLSRIFLPECLSIGSSAFYGCSKLNTVIFKKVPAIGLYAFSRCTNLLSLYLLDSSARAFPTAFSATGIGGTSGRIYVKESLIEDYRALWSTYSSYWSKIVGMTDEEIKELYEQEGYIDETANLDTTV